MKDGITFIDALVRHQHNPLSFPIPRDSLKRSIRSGDLVKIGVEGFQHFVHDELTADGERFWLRVTNVHEHGYEGTITNDLFFTEEHGLDSGDSLFFEARHILDVETIEEQTLPKVPGTPVAIITREMLSGELPRVSAAQCALDDHRHLVIGHLDSNELMATVILHRVADGETLMALKAAAKSLGLVPKALEEMDDKSGICQFAVMLSPEVDGPELLKRINESIDTVRREATRVTHDKSSDASQPQQASDAEAAEPVPVESDDAGKE